MWNHMIFLIYNLKYENCYSLHAMYIHITVNVFVRYWWLFMLDVMITWNKKLIFFLFKSHLKVAQKRWDNPTNNTVTNQITFFKNVIELWPISKTRMWS